MTVARFSALLVLAVERFAGAGRQVSMTGLERLAVVNARNPEVGRTDDPRARTFAELVDRRVLDNAYRYATLMLGDRADAEDATHDAALTAWRHLGELRDPAKFEAWFGRIVADAIGPPPGGRPMPSKVLDRER